MSVFASRRHLTFASVMTGVMSLVTGAALFAQAFQAPKLPVVGAGTGAISGTVVDAATGRPVAGAAVILTPIFDNIVGPGARQVTDDSGRYLFTDLGPGDGYLITAARFGYLDGEYGRDAPNQYRSRIFLTDAQWFRTATVKLWPLGAISGTVVDEFNEPVAGAYVRVLAEIPVAGQPQLAAGPSTRTDDRGVYRLARLAPGKYYVVVPSVQTAVPAATSLLTLSSTTAEAVASAEASGRSIALRRDPAIVVDPNTHLLVGSFVTPPPATPGTRPQAYPIYYYPSARDRSSALPVAVGYGEDKLGIDFRLTPVTTSRVTGRVAGPPDALANLTLRLMNMGDESLGRGSEAATALVAADGAFTFVNVPAGRYTIDASPTQNEYTVSPTGTDLAFTRLPAGPGQSRDEGASAVFAAPAGTAMTTLGNRRSAYFGSMRVDVLDTDVTGITLTLRRGATMSGRIVAETPPGGGAPSSLPSFMSAQVEPANGDPTLGMLRADNPPGDYTQFTINGLRNGEYLLRLSGPTVKSITWNGKDYTRTPFDASSGEDFTGIVITTTRQAVKITGTVRDTNGAPATAAVIYFPFEREQWSRYGLQPVRLRSVMASTNGAFEIMRNVPAGEYYLVAVSEALADGWKDPAFLEAAARVATRVFVGWSETKTQDLVIQQVKIEKDRHEP